MTDPGDKRLGWQRFLPENLWVVLIGPLIVGLAIVGVPAAVTGLTSEDPGPSIQALEPVVRNPESESEFLTLHSGLAASRQTDRSKARVEIRLQNTGERRTYITGAVVTVRRVIPVPPCGVGAGIRLSAAYDILIPRDVRPSDTVEVPINQTIPADGVDRFVFRIGRRKAEMDLTDFIYQLDLAVRHDNAVDPIDVGRVVVSLPGAPRADFFRTEDPSGCQLPVFDAVGEAAELDGARSPQLQSVFAALGEG
ncbi:MAG TPA: hypothetical protein VG816_04615 [Solirubrobacterales bacterium]|nr:hypothetical protein [Solirubrobacterales bacterium]